MKQYIVGLLLFFPFMAFAQIVKPGESFTDVYTFDGKVVFLKEIQLMDNLVEQNYLVVKNWMKKNYTGDPFNSSVDFKNKKHKAHAVSRVELLLPENSKGMRESIIMKYTFDAFIMDDICVMEITNVSFLNKPKVNGNTLPDKIKAEDMITGLALTKADENEETRRNTKKSTLFFLNQLSDSLQDELKKER